jgi:tRNA 5-methylaminomethyl-2-thiouridine biosynthesis bifunctional protein
MPTTTLDPRTVAAIAHPTALHHSQQLIGSSEIAERWRNRERHVVLDTHFDYGLHFLATWNAWRADPQRSRQLHYLAIVSRPYSASAMLELHTTWPQFTPLSQQLMQVWPTLVLGFHRVILAEDNVVLTLIFGDVEHNVAQIDAQIDTFFVDGVALGDLPEHRLKILATLLGRMAAPHAVLALEPALSSVATFNNSGFVFDAHTMGRLAHFAPRWQIHPWKIVPNVERHVIIIGAGLAGSAVAQRLAVRGWQISLIENQLKAAQLASGNRAGIFMPTLAKDDNVNVRLTRAAFLFALRVWQRLGGVGHAFAGEICGALQLARDSERASVAHEIAQTQRLPPEFAQWLAACAVGLLPGMEKMSDAVNQPFGAWLFAQGGWAHPAGVCEAMLAACGEQLHTYYGKNAVHIERIENSWHVIDANDNEIAVAPHVIIANGVDFGNFSQTADLPLACVRGQVTYVPAANVPDLPLVLCGDGYITRPFDGVCSVGATYDSDDDVTLRTDSQTENLQRLAQMLPLTLPKLTDLPVLGRVGFRCVSPDRLPLVGALADPEALTQFRGERLRDVPRLPGMYCLLGYASRGLIWAPLAAELLAAQMNGESQPMERELAATLDPARFMLAASRRSHK